MPPDTPSLPHPWPSALPTLPAPAYSRAVEESFACLSPPVAGLQTHLSGDVIVSHKKTHRREQTVFTFSRFDLAF